MKNVQRKKGYSVYVVAVVCLVVGLCIGYVAGFNHRAGFNQGPAAPSLNPALDVKATEIISELNCVCGCKMVLSTCTCEEVKGSKEIKLFVRDLVNMGSAKAEIVDRLKEKYGPGILIKKQV